MAEEISFDNCWWEIRQWFTSNENVGDNMLGYGSEEKLREDDKPLDPNMWNEDPMKQLDVGLIASENVNQVVASHAGEKGLIAGENVNQVVASHAGEKEIDDGDHVAKKKNGKGIVAKKRKRTDLAERIVVEKNRRDIEANLYRELLALLPYLTTKDKKATILQEAANSIISMEETLRGLEKQKQERLHGASDQTLVINTDSPNVLINSVNSDNITDLSSISFKAFASSNVTLNVCGADAVINIYSQSIPSLFATICYIFEKHNMEVVHTEISSDHAMTMYLIRVRANVPPELAKEFPYEGVYKEVVAQIMHLVTLMD